MPDQVSVKKSIALHEYLKIGPNFIIFFSMTCNCTIPKVPLVNHLAMWQKGGLAFANVNYNHGYSLGEITATMLC